MAIRLRFFANRARKEHFADAIWSKRTTGWTMENGRTSYHQSPDVPGKVTLLSEYPVVEAVQDIRLETQRNWIPKTPVLLGRDIANCYASTKPLVADIETNLMPLLDSQMRPELYGSALQCIRVRCSCSYFDNEWCKCNYITFDETSNLSKAALRSRLSDTFGSKSISGETYSLSIAATSIALTRGKRSKVSSTFADASGRAQKARSSTSTALTFGA